MNIRKDKYLLSDNKDLLDIERIYQMLSKTYWASNRTKERIGKSIENSLCFAIYIDKKQIGFTRVVTDEATFAWICDVIIDELYRGEGLGKWMMSNVVEYDKIKNIRQLLATKDAQGLYEMYGFVSKECMSRRKE